MTLVKRTLDELDWPNWFSRRLVDWPDSLREFDNEGMLKVEEFQDDGHLVVRAEMPGIDPDKDVELTVSDHTLQLRAERRTEERTEDTKGFRSEFRYGAFSRTVPLPVGASESDIEANYRDGILEVRVPVDAGEAAAKRIPIARE